uniref:Protein TFG-like isoform X3 n=1 Tax=Saccoglossus kowalevskii TaxID=10224 RepID=A0ABM0LZX4_SACKO|nr:PREDICTED: protein TFG-like isoform X3 [Saccoglossus kowalevskii]
MDPHTRHNDSGFPQIDLSNKLIIKVQLGDDIRRIPIHNEDITYDELLLMMQRVYRGRLNSSDEVTIKYKDEDNDLITIGDNPDLSFAIQCSRILKITLFVNGQPRPLESDQVKHLRKEITDLRNRLNQLLDDLEPPSLPRTAGKSSPSKAKDDLSGPILQSFQVNKIKNQAEEVHAGPPKQQNVMNMADTAAFDPYKQKESAPPEAVLQSFGIKDTEDARPVSPTDSNSSLGSSASQQIKQQQQLQQQQQQQPGYTQQQSSQQAYAPTQPGPAPQASPAQGQQPGQYGQSPVPGPQLGFQTQSTPQQMPQHPGQQQPQIPGQQQPQIPGQQQPQIPGQQQPQIPGQQQQPGYPTATQQQYTTQQQGYGSYPPGSQPQPGQAYVQNPSYTQSSQPQGYSSQAAVQQPYANQQQYPPGSVGNPYARGFPQTQRAYQQPGPGYK